MNVRIAKFVESLDVRVLLFACFIVGVFFMTLDRRISDICWFMAAITLIVIAAKGDWIRGSLDLQVIAFSIAVAISIIFSIDKGITLRYLKKDILRFLVIYFAGVQALKSEKSILWLCRTWLISALVTMLLGLGHYSRSHQLEGLFGHHTRYGKYLNLIIPFVIAFSIVEGNLLYIILIGITITVAMYSMVLTMSRGAWIGASFGIPSVLIMTKRWIWMIISVMLILIISLISPLRSNIYNRLLSIVHIERSIRTDISLKERFGYYKTALELIRERPTGWGYGRKIPKKIRMLKGESWFEKRGLTPFSSSCHNCYLEITLETGFLGLIAFMWLIVSVIFVCINNMKVNANTVKYGLSAGILCSLMSLMIQGMADNIFQSPYISIIAMYLAIISSIAKGERIGSKTKSAENSI